MTAATRATLGVVAVVALVIRPSDSSAQHDWGAPRIPAPTGAVSKGSVPMIPGHGVGVQERPDFSGAWSAQGGGSRGGRGGGSGATMGSGWGPDITISQDATTLTVERVFFSRGDLQPALKFRYSLQGMETTNSVLMGRGRQDSISSTAWEGETLVITSIQMVPDDRTGEAVAAEVRQALTLRRSGSLVQPPSLLIETTISGVLGGPPTTSRAVYTRR